MPPRRTKKSQLDQAIALFKEIKKLNLPPGFSAFLVFADSESSNGYTDAHHVFHEASLKIRGEKYIPQQHLESHIMIGAIIANRVRNLAAALAEHTPMRQGEIVDSMMGVAQQLLDSNETKEGTDG